ncbi:SDR family oxidoreductase [Granulicella arctica]|uniref:SDR family oxidoreductase n=1 Tax=Granulicella arctica TaxID=940613 RepID=UPI0021E0D7F0|nr:SDR family oxidoreductase [Granulicella arctica]
MAKAEAKTAIVTGASGGIGRAVAKRLAQDGFSVVLNYSGNADKAEQAVNEIKAAAGQATAIKADLSKEDEVASLFERSLSKLGQVDVVVHSAGVMPLSPIIKNDVKQFDEVIATNLRSTFLVLAQAAQHVADGGRIVALSSSVIAKSTPTYGAYIASKAGVEGLVKVLAGELRGRNISVNAVAPGPVATPLFLKDKTPEQIAQLSRIAPFERLGEPEDVARVISFLTGPDGGWINAQVVRPNGGFA